MTTFWQRLDNYPPCLCRLLAKQKYGPPLTDAQLADASGLTPAQVHAISLSTSWNGIDVHQMRAFTRACRTDFTNYEDMKRVASYLRGRRKRVAGKLVRVPRTFRFLRRSPDWKSFYEPLIARWLAHVRKQA